MKSVLQAKERKEFRNSALTQIRKEGKIPAVIYGTSIGSKAIFIDGAELRKTIQKVGRNGVFLLQLNDQQIEVILNDYQSDPVRRNIIHADFMAIDMSKEINADVRIVLRGEAAGVKDGGVLQQPLYEVSVTAIPGNIPQAIEVDVSELQVGETITIGDIKGQHNLKLNHDDEETVVSILPPKQEEEINTGEEQEKGIPENEEGRETQSVEE